MSNFISNQIFTTKIFSVKDILADKMYRVEKSFDMEDECISTVIYRVKGGSRHLVNPYSDRKKHQKISDQAI